MAYYTQFIPQKAGEDFEDDIVEALQEAHIGYEFHQVRGSREDINHGTDFFIGRINKGLRVDVTLDFSSKKFMPFIKDTGLYAGAGQNFMIGIRHGNSHDYYTEFDEPVIVLGVNLEACDYRYTQMDMMSAVRRNANELVNACFDAYIEYTTLDPESRKEIDDHVDFSRNPYYKRPRSLGKEYRRANRLQDDIIDYGRNEDNMPGYGDMGDD